MITREDFHCKGCNSLRLDNSLWTIVKVLENRVWGLKVTSGYRCKDHNEHVGGVENSYHCQGKAVDLQADSYEDLARAVWDIKTGGIGLYPKRRFVHVDVGEKTAVWVSTKMKKR